MCGICAPVGSRARIPSGCPPATPAPALPPPRQLAEMGSDTSHRGSSGGSGSLGERVAGVTAATMETVGKGASHHPLHALVHSHPRRRPPGRGKQRRTASLCVCVCVWNVSDGGVDGCERKVGKICAVLKRRVFWKRFLPHKTSAVVAPGDTPRGKLVLERAVRTRWEEPPFSLSFTCAVSPPLPPLPLRRRRAARATEGVGGGCFSVHGRPSLAGLGDRAVAPVWCWLWIEERRRDA